MVTPAPAPVKSDRDFVPLVRVLLRALRAAEHAAVETLRESGLTVAGPAAWNLLRALPEHGARASHLAGELGVSKQAIGQTVRVLRPDGSWDSIYDHPGAAFDLIVPGNGNEGIAFLSNPTEDRGLIRWSGDRVERIDDEGENGLRAATIDQRGVTLALWTPAISVWA